jgi:hypothetical protein
VPKPKRNLATSELRELVADEAARVMMEQGIGDYSTAKRKAAERLRLSQLGALPSNRQVEQSLLERQRVFEPEEHELRLERLRRIALMLMDELGDYEPRLVGPVLTGTATINAVVEIHVFADSPEEVGGVLARCGRSARSVERRVRWRRNTSSAVPSFRLTVRAADVLILVFPPHGIRQAPLSPVDQRPMRRARRSEIAALVRRV